MAEEEVKCPLCDRKYKSSKALVKHLKDNHKDAPDLLDLTKSVPKSPPQPCRFCGLLRTNLWQHEQTCPSRTPAAEEQEPNNEETNDEFVIRFRDNYLMRPCFNLAKNTVADYTRYVRKFIGLEVLHDPSFRAWHWTAPRREDFRSLRDSSQYVVGGEGTSTVKNKGAAWKKLHEYIGEFLNSRHNTPLTQWALAEAKHKNFMKGVRQGTFNAPKTGGEERPPRQQQEPIDPEVTRRVVRAWQNSTLRRDALARFAQGYPSFEPLGITDMKGVRAILALELLIRGKGIRFDAVRNITVDAIKQARRTKEKCPYCGSLVDYLVHKEKCNLREKKLKNGEDYDSGSNLGTRYRYSILCIRHKTDQLGAIEHIVKKELLQLLLWFCANQKERVPFERCTRYQVSQTFSSKFHH
jgi:hypothetical protein